MAETLEHHADYTADAIANDDKQDKKDKKDKKKTRTCKKTSKKRIQLEEDPEFVQDDNTRNKDDKPKK